MKYMRIILTLLLLLTLIPNRTVIVLAMNTGFSTEILSNDERNAFLTNVNISVLEEEPPKRGIECFDVSEDGMIAIGSSVSDSKIIGVYTIDGIFQYGYEFSCSGSFGVEWDKDEIIIYLVRSDIAVAVNSVGKVEDIQKIQNTVENNSYWNRSVFSTQKVVGDNAYTIKNGAGILNVFASSYSQLVVTNAEDKTNIIYDVDSSETLRSVVIFIAILIFVGVVVFFVLQQFVKMRHKG